MNADWFAWLPDGWQNLRLAEPLWLLAWILLLGARLWRRRRPAPVHLVPYAAAWAPAAAAPTRRFAVWTAYSAAALLILALARPQRIDDRRIVRGEGYDLIIAVDLSTSMFAEDSRIDGVPVNRLEALKPVLEAFLRRRPSDRIGFVAFAGRAYTLAPLTHDHDWLARQVARLQIGLIEDGTALGDGLGLALSRLERARGESTGTRAGAFVVLMTDGSNNTGTLSPEQAAELAKKAGVVVHTIGVGRDGIVPVPLFDDNRRRVGTGRAMSDLDTSALRTIAAITGGAYFRAEEPSAAQAAFAEIDRRQKVTFDQTTQVTATELYSWPAALAGLLLLAATPALLRRA